MNAATRFESKLEQLNLESRLGSFERKRDVLSLHVRHAHVSCRRTTIDRRQVLLPEAQDLEELDGSRGIRHRDGYLIGVAEHPHHPLHRWSICGICDGMHQGIGGGYAGALMRRFRNSENSRESPSADTWFTMLSWLAFRPWQ